MPGFAAHPFRALRSRGFRIYFAGQFVSLAGTWMQQVAMGWLVYRLTGSALVLGLLGFAGQLPILLFGAVGGVWLDRWDRRRLMMATQFLSLVQASVLALLTWQGWITPPLLLFLAFVTGCINALDLPARQSLVVHLVDDRSHLANAIALQSMLINTTRFVGPSLAGFIIAVAGEAACFTLNALSYLAVLLALAVLRVRTRGDRSRSAAHALREGLAYAFGHPGIRFYLLLVASVSFLVTPYTVLMPLFASTILGAGADTFGLLVGSAGAGSLVGGLYLASRASTTGLDRLVPHAAVLSGVALALFALNSQLALAFPILMVLGFSVVFVAAGSNTLLQTWVRDDMRGRVMATFSMAFLGVAPLGSLAVGSLSHLIGVRPTLVACGLATMLVAAVHARRQGAASGASAG